MSLAPSSTWRFAGCLRISSSPSIGGDGSAGRCAGRASTVGRSRGSSHLDAQDPRHIWTYQIAALVQPRLIAPGAVAVKLFFPFHHVCLAPVFLNQPADAVVALAGALGAFDAEHVEFSFDVTEDEIGPPRHDGDIITCRQRRARLSQRARFLASRL
jgi:hypothetical protein